MQQAEFDPVSFVENLRVKYAASGMADRPQPPPPWRDILIGWGVPRDYVATIDPDAMGVTEAVRAATSWHKSMKPYLVLSGPPGVGKTVAAALWLKELTVGMTLQKMKRRWVFSNELNRSNVYSGDALTDICTVLALVLDDVGSEYRDKGGLFESTINHVFESRSSLPHRTIITTNLPLREFSSRVGERAWSRIRGYGDFVRLTGDDMRQRNRT